MKGEAEYIRARYPDADSHGKVRLLRRPTTEGKNPFEPEFIYGGIAEGKAEPGPRYRLTRTG